MVEIGEETGELPDMLTRIADNYDEDVDNAVAGVTSNRAGDDCFSCGGSRLLS